jgi:Ca2+-binding RTX toxin-like protein
VVGTRTRAGFVAFSALGLFAALLTLPAAHAAAVVTTGTAVETGMSLTFSVHDPVRERVYVSSLEGNEVVAVSTTKAKIVRTWNFTKPTGLALSSDGGTLYVSLFDDGAVARLDLRTGSVSTIDVEADLGDRRAWDLLLIDDDTLLVSGNPGSNGFAWIVRVDLANGNATDRVASGTIIRAAPRLSFDGDRYVYVGSGFSPNSLYKLDLETPNLDIVLEDDHGSVSGTRRLAASPRGDFVLLSSGQKLAAQDFTQVADYGPGYPLFDPTGRFAYMIRTGDGGQERATVDVINPATDRTLRTLDTTCALMAADPAIGDAELVGDEQFVIVAGRRVCLVGFDLTLPLCNGLAPTLLGTRNDDVLIGSAHDDVIIGGNGADTIDGRGGNDTECGNGGRDIFVANGGDDYTRGGPGGDLIDYGAVPNAVTVSLRRQVASGIGNDRVLGIENVAGTRYPDEIDGNGRANTIEGGGGDDTIFGFKNADTIFGGPGSDYIDGGLSPDVIDAGGGDDIVEPGAGNDSIAGGNGSDWIAFESSPKPVTVKLKLGTATGHGADSFASIENVFGSVFGDTIVGDDLENWLYGSGGDDLLKGERGDDILVGQDGDDRVFGVAGNDVVVGNGGRDRLDGGAGFDLADFFTSPVGVAVDLSAGTATGDGPDVLVSVEDVVGSTHNDVLLGTSGHNAMFGLEGNDVLVGYAGNDYLDGGPGNDRLDAGSGTDICVDGETPIGCESTQALAFGLEQGLAGGELVDTGTRPWPAAHLFGISGDERGWSGARPWAVAPPR